MIELTQVLENVAATNKPGEKQEAIKDISEETLKLIAYALNPYITFGVKKIPEGDLLTAKNSDESEDLKLFWTLADQLAARELTGGAAQTEIGAVLGCYELATQETLTRVLKKDLRANLGRTIVNKVHAKTIPEFKCMLAKRLDKKYDWGNEEGYLVEIKYDGMRELTEVVGELGEVTHKTREGRLDDKFDGIFDANLMNLWEVAADHFNTDAIWVDGEVLYEDPNSDEPFRDTMKARKSGADKSKLVYRIFEILTKEEWESKKTTRPLSERRATLERLIWIVADEDYNIQPSHGQVCYSEEEMMEYYEPLVAQGAEGVIIKPMASSYEWKRSKLWTKHTPVFTADLRITGRYLGAGKNENRLGGFNLEGELEDGTFVVADVGSGFSDAQRDEFWEMDEDLLCSMVAEIEYREISYAKETPSLRFPAFKHIREDKSA